MQEQKRKLFHSPLYESEIHLKRLYIQTCKRLPSYGCHVFQVKELLRGKTKKRAHRVLGIGIEHVVLLDSKTLVLSKSQHTSELQQWRAGGGRSHDRLVLEFRGTKWSFVAAQSLRSIGSVLWEIMQDLDARFLDEHLITTREELDKESHRNMVSVHGLERATIYKEELERLQGLLHFPEEVAVRLTDVEYELFYSVSPVHYVRQVTVDLSGKAATFNSADKDRTVQTLIKRFNEIADFIGERAHLAHTKINSRSHLLLTLSSPAEGDNNPGLKAETKRPSAKKYARWSTPGYATPVASLERLGARLERLGALAHDVTSAIARNC
ncbi:hypothetical protein HPB48_014130 [Haemaphysalis longicornis]|uniref:Uncharacterized protein n=1 Tax=Haemaphysalis longicornis TaxID=44386 RepID=A0A9J6FKU4_HAELO|nr:hypothetical protein HPB48_014130 [Haemaphysalis longicornis]